MEGLKTAECEPALSGVAEDFDRGLE